MTWSAWPSVAIAIVLQALPFLMLGVIVSSAVVTLIPHHRIATLLPGSKWAAVPVAAGAGALLPGCECASVPLAGRLVRAGLPQPSALAFLLAAPAINPVVIVSTAVAFTGSPEVPLARFLAGLAVATTVGLLWRVQPMDLGTTSHPSDLHDLHDHPTEPPGAPTRSLVSFAAVARHDLLDAATWLVVGAVMAATLKVLVPERWFTHPVGGVGVAIVMMAALAVVSALCSEADAFVAASFVGVPLVARLVFLVVGPCIDLKLLALHRGVFGVAFVRTFAPLTLAVAIIVGTVVGTVLL